MESARTSAKLCQLLLDHGAETKLAMEVNILYVTIYVGRECC